MKTAAHPLEIAVFFNAPGYNDDPFDKPIYVQAYHELASRLQSRGGRLSIVRDQQSYRGGNAFEGGWVHDGETFRRTEQTLAFDVLFNRRNLRADADAVVVNEPKFDDLCTDKSKTYALFPALSPKTFIVQNTNELEKSIASLGALRIVAKPLNLESGEGVFIGPADEIRRSVTTFPYLIQEFIDTSGGIPGIMENYHDFRIAAVQDCITHSYYRVPGPGSLVANTRQGGQTHYLALDRIPKEAFEIFRRVDASLKNFPNRIFSVDMGRGRDGIRKIIELNSKPGLRPLSEHPTIITFHEKICDVLIDTASR